jgi:ankyrin repeat protein
MSATMASPKLIQLLLSKGAPVDEADDVGRTALHFAAKQGDPATVRALLEGGADPTRWFCYLLDQPITCTNPARFAAHFGHSKVAKLLLQEVAVWKAERGNPIDPNEANWPPLIINR